MSLAQFLNVLGSCIGFMSALFFATGALLTSPKDIFNTASMRWDINQHWADSIAEQRADYIAGALLLLLSFSSQLSANLVPPALEPSILQPYAIAEIVSVIALLLVCSVFLRGAVTKSTKETVRRMQEERLAQEQAKIELRKKS